MCTLIHNKLIAGEMPRQCPLKVLLISKSQLSELTDLFRDMKNENMVEGTQSIVA